MTPTEMKELDAWIAENVIGWLKTKRGLIPATKEEWKKYQGSPLFNECDAPNYTTDPAAAMLVLEKCYGVGIAGATICIWRTPAGKHCVGSYHDNEKQATADTLPLAICLFAKKLFEKGTK